MAAVEAAPPSAPRNIFYDMCDETVTCVQSFEAALSSFLAWKDEMLTQTLPVSLLTTLAVEVAKVRTCVSCTGFPHRVGPCARHDSFPPRSLPCRYPFASARSIAPRASCTSRCIG